MYKIASTVTDLSVKFVRRVTYSLLFIKNFGMSLFAINDAKMGIIRTLSLEINLKRCTYQKLNVKNAMINAILAFLEDQIIVLLVFLGFI